MTNKKEKVKEEKYKSEEQQEIVRFVKILAIVVIFIVLVYFITRIFVKKDLTNNESKTTVTEVNYSKMVFGTLLNRPYEEYYVIAFSSQDNKANYYNALGDKYSSAKNSMNLYYIDLEDSMNKDFIAKDGKTNPAAKTIDELKVGDITLIKVKNGNITKYIENIGDIKRELSIN